MDFHVHRVLYAAEVAPVFHAITRGDVVGLLPRDDVLPGPAVTRGAVGVVTAVDIAGQSVRVKRQLAGVVDVGAVFEAPEIVGEAAGDQWYQLVQHRRPQLRGAGGDLPEPVALPHERFHG